MRRNGLPIDALTVAHDANFALHGSGTEYAFVGNDDNRDSINAGSSLDFVLTSYSAL